MSDEKEVARRFRVPDGATEAGLPPVATSGDAESNAERPPALTIEVTLASKLSLADFQNAIPLLRELALASTLADDTGQVELSLSSTPAFVKPKTWRLDAIKAGDRYRIATLTFNSTARC